MIWPESKLNSFSVGLAILGRRFWPWPGGQGYGPTALAWSHGPGSPCLEILTEGFL